MNFTSLGDLSQSFLLRNRNADLRTEMQNLQVEVATGITHDTRGHLRGDYTHLSEIERNLSVLDGYKIATQEAENTTRAMQTSLTAIEEKMSALASDLMLATQTGGERALTSAASAADGVFRSIVSHLNAASGGRALFSGANTESPALTDADVILSQLRAEIAGETTVSGIEQRIDDWFHAPGGGFETIGYSGGLTDGSPFRLADDTQVAVSLRADHQVFRDILSSVAKAALASPNAAGQTQQTASLVMRSAGERLLSVQNDLIDVQAGVGLSQELIDDSVARNEAASTALQIARNEFLAVDQYEKATALEAAQSQIEALYAVTVRASRLSLLEFMR